MARLDTANESAKLLLVLTPDDSRPASLDNLNDDERVVWSSFTLLDQAINELLEDSSEVVSEREAFLFRELQAMFEAEGLLASPNDVVVVAARRAWQEYNDVRAYICQPNRSFQHVSRLGFYSRGRIYPLVPRILESHDDVEIRRDAHKRELGRFINGLIDEGQRFKGHASLCSELTGHSEFGKPHSK